MSLVVRKPTPHRQPWFGNETLAFTFARTVWGALGLVQFNFFGP